PHLPESERPLVLAEALAAGWAIGDEEYRARTLVALAPHLPLSMLPDALKAIRFLGGEHEALAGLARYLPETQRGLALADALEATQVIRHEAHRARALARLVPHLPAHLLAGALEAISSIASERTRAEILTGLVPHLPETLRGLALAQGLEA